MASFKFSGVSISSAWNIRTGRACSSIKSRHWSAVVTIQSILSRPGGAGALARAKAVLPAIAKEEFVPEKTPLPVEDRLTVDETQTLGVLRRSSSGIRHDGELYFKSTGMTFYDCSRKQREIGGKMRVSDTFVFPKPADGFTRKDRKLRHASRRRTGSIRCKLTVPRICPQICAPSRTPS
jgi:hypothetical protein